jgi:hypothetical protein
MTFPMLGDFALRLACGLAALLLLTPWRVVPSAFFRTHGLVILGLLVLAGLDAGRFGSFGPTMGLVVSSAVLAYLATVTWGIGLPRVAWPVTAGLTVLSAAALVTISRVDDAGLWALNSLERLASACLMGATLTAMLLGHYYLTAPAMSIEPLKRFVRAAVCSLGARAAIAALGLALWAGASAATQASTVSPLFLAVRWGMGVVGPAVALWMTWKTVEIRSTQSATGILYIGMTLVLFGELTAMVMSRETGAAF